MPDFNLVEEPDGDAIIHEVELAEPFTDSKAPVAAIAVDLMGSLATRERSAGQRVIDELIRRRSGTRPTGRLLSVTAQYQPLE